MTSNRETSSKTSSIEPDMVRQRLAAVELAPQGAGAVRDELRSGQGIAAGEQRDFVPQPDQFFRQVRDDPFGPAVQFREGRFQKAGPLVRWRMTVSFC